MRGKPIEGVATSTTGFVGPTRSGPAAGEPPLLTSYADFEDIYGGLEPLEFEDRRRPRTNYVAHAARAFFAEGGRRLYVSRVHQVSVRGNPSSAGLEPGSAYYAGFERDGLTSGLLALEGVDEIAVVAAPGATHDYATREAAADAINDDLITHCEKRRYRIAVLDSGNRQSVGDVRKMCSRLDSTYAALYYPWVTVIDPVTRRAIDLPPSGFLSGIYARTDMERGVHTAPANEVVRSAVGFEAQVNQAQQDVLNPEGINCLRFFEGRGHRVWGSRTVSSDPEWKYVNVRRYCIYLENSIVQGTGWVVPETNDEPLWGNARREVSDFLAGEWRNGRLAGTTPEQAFFVRCDRTTMTQNDIDNGRLVCLIGVAPVRPAEFVIFRIGQKTAEAD